MTMMQDMMQDTHRVMTMLDTHRTMLETMTDTHRTQIKSAQ